MIGQRDKYLLSARNKCLLGHPDHSLVNIQTMQTQLLAFHEGFLKIKGTFYYDNLVHIVVNVPLFMSTAKHSILCIKQAKNQWRVLLLQRNIMVVYQQHLIHTA